MTTLARVNADGNTLQLVAAMAAELRMDEDDDAEDRAVIEADEGVTATVKLLKKGTCTFIIEKGDPGHEGGIFSKPVSARAGHTGQVYCLAALPDGRLASGSTDATVRVWDVRGTSGGSCVLTLNRHTDQVNCIVVLPDGRLASCSNDNTLVGCNQRFVCPDAECDKTIRLWDVTSG